MNVVESLINISRDLEFYFFRQGGWGLNFHEKMVIDAVINVLPIHVKSYLQSQLTSRIFVIRQPKQISRLCFYKNIYSRERQCIDDIEFFEKVIDVQIDVDGQKEIANVEFYRGRIDSIQFRRPPKYYAGKAISVVGVKQGKVGRTHAKAIDRLEHGRNP